MAQATAPLRSISTHGQVRHLQPHVYMHQRHQKHEQHDLVFHFGWNFQASTSGLVTTIKPFPKCIQYTTGFALVLELP